MRTTLHHILMSHRTRQPIVMGVLNITPDSFSDGGDFLEPAAAVDRAGQMLEEGADMLDLGAESTRPGSARVGPDEQIARLREILPAICELAAGTPVSVDTTSIEVASFALRCGASIVNDISAGRDSPDLFALIADRPHCALVLMHMQGRPRSMQRDPRYDDVVAEVSGFLSDRLRAAENAGVAKSRCILDPGIGFGKRLEHNLALLAGVDRLAALGVPVLIGASRKRFIGEITGVEMPADRSAGSLAAACAAYTRGATIFRVHDVAPTRQALDVLARIEGA